MTSCRLYAVALLFAVVSSGTNAEEVSLGPQATVFVTKGNSLLVYDHAVQLLPDPGQIAGFVGAKIEHDGRLSVVSINKEQSKLERQEYSLKGKAVSSLENVDAASLLVSSRGEMFLLPQNSLTLKTFDVDDTVPPSVCVSALPLNGKLCVFYQKSRHESDEFADCAILDSKSGAVLDSFPINQFFAAPNISEVCWIDDQYVLCVTTTVHGVIFDILDTKTKRLVPRALSGSSFRPDFFRVINNQLILFRIANNSVNALKVELK